MRSGRMLTPEFIEDMIERDSGSILHGEDYIYVYIYVISRRFGAANCLLCLCTRHRTSKVGIPINNYLPIVTVFKLDCCCALPSHFTRDENIPKETPSYIGSAQLLVNYHSSSLDFPSHANSAQKSLSTAVTESADLWRAGQSSLFSRFSSCR